MEALPGPLTAQEVARARRSAGGEGSVEAAEAKVATSPVVSTPVVPDTGTMAAESTGTMAAKSSGTMAAESGEPPLVAKSAFVKVNKTLMTFSQEGFCRKFHVKDYGTPQMALLVAEEFSKHVAQTRSEFEHLTKKPDQRQLFLEKFGWPKEKSCKRKLKDQMSFVLSALCQEKWPQLEACLMLTALGLKKKGCTLTHTTDGFKARVTPTDGTAIEKTFESLPAARKWIMQVMSVED